MGRNWHLNTMESLDNRSNTGPSGVFNVLYQSCLKKYGIKLAGDQWIRPPKFNHKVLIPIHTAIFFNFIKDYLYPWWLDAAIKYGI